MSDNWRDNVKTEEETEKLPLTPERLLKMLFHIFRQFDDPYYAGFAAQIAYFFFMSAAPMLIVISQLLGIFDISVDFIREWLEGHLSTQMTSFMEGLFRASSTTIPNILMLLLALWSSSALAFSLSRLTTYTISGGTYRYNFFTERLKAIPMAMITIMVVAVSLGVYVYGETIALRVLKSPYLVRLISNLRTPILAGIFFLVILSSYYIVLRIRVPIVAILPGSIVATLGILFSTWVYSVYTGRAGRYNILYGAFSNIVAMMLWFYLLSWVLCIGMMFNKSWDIILKRGRLTPEKIKEYIYKQYGSRGGEKYNKLIIEEYDMTDRSLDSVAVKVSRKLDPGYDDKREREIAEAEEEREVRERVEQIIEDEKAEEEHTQSANE